MNIFVYVYIDFLAIFSLTWFHIKQISLNFHSSNAPLQIYTTSSYFTESDIWLLYRAKLCIDINYQMHVNMHFQ